VTRRGGPGRPWLTDRPNNQQLGRAPVNQSRTYRAPVGRALLTMSDSLPRVPLRCRHGTVVPWLLSAGSVVLVRIFGSHHSSATRSAPRRTCRAPVPTPPTPPAHHRRPSRPALDLCRAITRWDERDATRASQRAEDPRNHESSRRAVLVRPRATTHDSSIPRGKSRRAHHLWVSPV
jgi:hypothetical protein